VSSGRCIWSLFQARHPGRGSTDFRHDRTLGEGAPAPDGRRGRLIGVSFVIGTFVLCLIRLAGFVQTNAVNVLCEDEWDFLQPLFDGRGPWSCFFWQHGPHRQGLGGLVDWCIFNATAWDVRAEAWAAVVVLSLATIAAIALAARLRGYLSWSDAAYPLLLLGPIHWETMIFTQTSPIRFSLCCSPFCWRMPGARQPGDSGHWGRSIRHPHPIYRLWLLRRASHDRPGVGAVPATSEWRETGRSPPDHIDPGHARPGSGRFCPRVSLDRGTPWQFPVPNWWDYHGFAP